MNQSYAQEDSIGKLKTKRNRKRRGFFLVRTFNELITKINDKQLEETGSFSAESFHTDSNDLSVDWN